MEGKRALFPQGYHCTGMPIKSCADKLAREMEMFGKNFENYKEEDAEEDAVPAPTQETTKTDVLKFGAKKSKAAAKNVAMKYQFQIMGALGLEKEEIHKFADPNHWIDHFPPLCERDLTNIGARIDWRRSFVTTDRNPYYDSFVMRPFVLAQDHANPFSLGTMANEPLEGVGQDQVRQTLYRLLS